MLMDTSVCLTRPRVRDRRLLLTDLEGGCINVLACHWRLHGALLHGSHKKQFEVHMCAMHFQFVHLLSFEVNDGNKVSAGYSFPVCFASAGQIAVAACGAAFCSRDVLGLE